MSLNALRRALVSLVAVWVISTGLLLAQRPAHRPALPAGVIEHTGLGVGTVVELKDGTILANNGRISRDGGKTWSEPRSLGPDIAGNGFVRLKSGALALTASVGYLKGMLWVSTDEGKTWTARAPIRTSGGARGRKWTLDDAPVYDLGDVMIQLSGGRLLTPWDVNFTGKHPEFPRPQVIAWGLWRGQRLEIEGHQHVPEFFATSVSYSEDEGKTWELEEVPGGGITSTLMGWFDTEGIPNGLAGLTPFGECSIAETADGRVLMMGRSTVGRVAQTYSRDGGKMWSAVLPSELAGSGSPPRLRRIPKTGDLLVVWNQVSREEIRRGYRRGRLSAAISKDSGATWQNFKTLELSEGLDEIGRIAPEYPILPNVRARDFVGELPEGFSYAHYANVCFVGDKVFVMYPRGAPLLGIAEQNLDKQEQVLRIYPLEWFYK